MTESPHSNEWSRAVKMGDDPMSFSSWLRDFCITSTALGLFESMGCVVARPLHVSADALLAVSGIALATLLTCLIVTAVMWLSRRMLRVLLNPGPSLPPAVAAVVIWSVILIVVRIERLQSYAGGTIALVIVALVSLLVMNEGLKPLWPRALARREWPFVLLYAALVTISLWLVKQYGSSWRIAAVIGLVVITLGGVIILRRHSRFRSVRSVAAVGLLTMAATIPAWPSQKIESHIAAPPDSPNVLLVTIDTLRADHLQHYGYTKARTEAIERLASEGAVFETALSPSAITCPSHASILTGMDPFGHGILSNHGMRLRQDAMTLADVLQARGYTTAAFVAGEPLKSDNCGLGDRFNVYDDDFSQYRWLPSATSGASAMRLLQPALKHCGFDLERLERPAEEIVDRVMKWMADQPAASRRPFFVWAHFYDPHIPYSPPAKYVDYFDPGYTGSIDGNWYSLSEQQKDRIARNPADVRHMIARYDGEIAYVSDQIGRLTDSMKKSGQMSRTIIVITSDHGESHGERGHFFTRDLYRSCLRVPLIIWGPGVGIHTARIASQVRSIDIMPTILELMKINEPLHLHGKSLTALMRGEKDTTNRPAFALAIYRKWLESKDHGMYVLEENGLKYMWNSSHWEGDILVPVIEELYDVVQDANETANIISQSPSELNALRSRLKLWRSQPRAAQAPAGKNATDRLRRLGYVN